MPEGFARSSPHLVNLKPDDLVFTTAPGSVVRSANWRQGVSLPVRKRAGISDRFRVHDLRHTAAALMIQAGYPPKMLQEILGHASIATTLDLYGNSRELHQTGEKPQVAMSGRGSSGLSKAFGMAA